jgi:hypothetical protein
MLEQVMLQLVLFVSSFQQVLKPQQLEVQTLQVPFWQESSLQVLF